jgi:DNA topoisomerase-2
VDENYHQLNYGKLIILTDADPDGKHIGGLIMNFIHCLFPSLLERKNPSFLVEMMTPIAKFFMKGETKVFYSTREADMYYRANIGKNIRIKYYKGLGSHSDEEIEEEFGKRVISFFKDECTDANMLKAFYTKASDQRKKWIEEYDPNIFHIYDENIPEKSISAFINEDLIAHPIDNCARSIPNIMDGLKQSQRKILYACFLKNLTKTTLKVSQLSGYVAEKTNYHHGEENLYDTITKMANEFVGSNNIPLLFRDGQFGSRMECGKDAANARYILTKLELITRYLFREEDDVLMESVIDDGDEVEPVFYVPILPMILINGTEGIGTGWACSVPCYNPLDIIECVKTWIENENCVNLDNGMTVSLLPDIKPWYRGFTGSIVDSGDGKYTTFGVCERDDSKKNTVVITEIPVFTSIVSVKEKLDELTYGKDSVLKSYKNYSSADKPYFVIEESPDGLRCTPENLKLYSHISGNNMVMYDENGKIRKYDSIDEIIDNFCKVRLRYYTLRKNHLLKTKETDLILQKNKKRFLEEVMDGVIVLNRKKESAIVVELDERGYDKHEDGYGYLLQLPIKSFTEEKVDELLHKMDKLQKEIDTLSAISEKDMWLSDIEEFRVKYVSWLGEMETIEKKRAKTRKRGTKEPVKRIPKKRT